MVHWSHDGFAGKTAMLLVMCHRISKSAGTLQKSGSSVCLCPLKAPWQADDLAR